MVAGFQSNLAVVVDAKTPCHTIEPLYKDIVNTVNSFVHNVFISWTCFLSDIKELSGKKEGYTQVGSLFFPVLCIVIHVKFNKDIHVHNVCFFITGEMAHKVFIRSGRIVSTDLTHKVRPKSKRSVS